MVKKITIDDLALMIGKGFVGVDKKFEAIDKRLYDITETTATKNGMISGFKAVNKRFDNIENILLKQHSEKIERLEKRIIVLEEAMSIKN
jgi:hypothetical protein